mmetsp:Transcript_7845/g.14789  ORF Transcript_7845/g.14789 Transcript_7845/m.14789 type:complete len:90 (-) Transcript_7845:2261-2530(-)
MRGNPRRDAFEYGVLLFYATSLTAGIGLMLYMKNTSKGLGDIDLNAPVDFQGAWNELLHLKRNTLVKDRLGENSKPSDVKKPETGPSGQ